MAIELLAALLSGYLLGSIPFGLLLTRAAGLGDVRHIGSGNIGATNVLRTGNKTIAAATLLLDGLKGFVAVMAVPYFLHGITHLDGTLFYPDLIVLLSGLGAVLGHLFPLWLGFRGGKGVATFIGVTFGFAWPLGLVFCMTWLATAILSRYSSLSALVATGITVMAAFIGKAGIYRTAEHPQPVANTVGGVLLMLAILVFWKHRENISRLKAGTESRIGAKG